MMISGLPCHLTLSVLICLTSVVAASVVYGQFVDQDSTELGGENQYDPMILRDDDIRGADVMPLNHVSYRTIRKFKRNWNKLNSMWGKRSHDIERRGDGDQKWNNLRSMWGKRSAERSSKTAPRPSWIQLRGMWGKRSKVPGPPALSRTIVLDDSDKLYEDSDQLSEDELMAMYWNDIERFLRHLQKSHND